MIVIGLTGGIGMGKSTVARMFAGLGAAVSDADQVVHALWEKEPTLTEWAREHCPESIGMDGKVDRKILGKKIFSDDPMRVALEELIHPMVVREEERLVEAARLQGKKVAVIEIPLLFETGAEKRVDLTITVTAPEGIQHRRVLSRPGMDAATYQRVIKRQLDDEERCAKADLVIPTGGSEEETRAIVHAMWHQIMQDYDQLEKKSHA